MEAARPLGFLIAASIVALASAVMLGRLVFKLVVKSNWSLIAVKAAVSARYKAQPSFMACLSSGVLFLPLTLFSDLLFDFKAI